jgi:hypothetical protein
MNTYQFVLDLANELKWPLVIVIVVVVAIVISRVEVRDFIKRTYWISPTGVKATRQNPQIVSSNTGSGPAIASPDFTRQLSATVDPYVLDQRANTIYAEFDSRGIGPGQREEHLIPLLAAALIRESWERTYLWIFGTQIRLLQKLNESAQGLTEGEVRGIYQTGTSQYPEVYRAYPFENWIAFMETATLTMKYIGRYLITPYGRGFLKYLVAQGLSFERPG